MFTDNTNTKREYNAANRRIEQKVVDKTDEASLSFPCSS